MLTNIYYGGVPFIISPDGLKTAFCVPDSNIGNRYNLNIIDTNGNNKRFLTEITSSLFSGYFIKFSLDGSEIIFDSSGEIYVINTDGSNLTRLTQSTDYIMSIHPIYTNDGEKIVFQKWCSP